MIRSQVVRDIATLVTFDEECRQDGGSPPSSTLLRRARVRGFFHPLGGLVAGYIFNEGEAPFHALTAAPPYGPPVLVAGAEGLFCEVSHVWLRSSLSEAERRSFYEVMATDVIDSGRPYVVSSATMPAGDWGSAWERTVLYHGPGCDRPEGEVTEIFATRTEAWVHLTCSTHLEPRRVSISEWLTHATDTAANDAPAPAAASADEPVWALLSR